MKQYISQYKSFKNHQQPLSLLLHHYEESEALQPPSSLLHRLFSQPSTPGPLPSMMRPFFPFLSPRSQPSERRFLPARWGGSSQTSPPSDLFPLASSASPLLPQVDINNIEHERQGEGEYYVCIACHHTQNSPGDVRRDGVCCSLADLSSQNCGGLPALPLPGRYRS